MSDSNLKSAAFQLAESTPKYLDKDTLPPISWRQDGDILIVILADGRKIRAPIVQPSRKKADIPVASAQPSPLPAKRPVRKG